MSEKYEVYLLETKGWHPCEVTKRQESNVTVKLTEQCKFDEEMDNEVSTKTSYQTTKKHLRPVGASFGELSNLENGQTIEVWQSISDQPYGWYKATVTRIKKNVIYISSAVEEVELDPMTPKKATRNPNPAVLEDSVTIYVEVPEFLKEWIHTEDGGKLLNKCQERKELQECYVDEEHLTLVGGRAQVDAAAKYLKFNFDNLEYVDKLKSLKSELSTKLTTVISKFKTQCKVEFSVPGEIVGILVGQQYKKLKTLQEKYKVNIRVSDEENERVRFTISGNDQAVIDLMEKKLHVSKYEYKMDKKLVSFLVGQKGDRIRTIIQNSQLIKIDFDNATGTSNKNEKICFLYGNQEAIAEGIEYINATAKIQNLIDETNQEIADLNKRTEDVLLENGYYRGYEKDSRDNRDTRGRNTRDRNRRDRETLPKEDKRGNNANNYDKNDMEYALGY